MERLKIRQTEKEGKAGEVQRMAADMRDRSKRIRREDGSSGNKG